ncbi:hypothetical protein BsIDN1_58640 [Bacillus safensis]|uniref:Uncharacterized protein n=1 Tax=Bacillus safensis TaxID=561879 RepID=A0A5S9MKU7_BACIA|nr:hypothetical protein BsIDN1_58640 [Bacillus safensis]
MIDSKKNTVYSYHRPKSIPTSYQKDEMIKIFEKREFKDYKMYFWPIEIDQESFTVLYGFKTNSTKGSQLSETAREKFGCIISIFG